IVARDYLIPAGTAHVVAATDDGPGRALGVVSPSGVARPVTKAGTPGEGGGGPPAAAPGLGPFLRVCAGPGGEILCPPRGRPASADIQTKSGCDRRGSSGRRR